MRLDLDSDPSKFLRQVEQVRRSLSSVQAGEGQAPLSARLALSVYVPFMTALRSERRALPGAPGIILTVGAVEGLIANIVKTTVETLSPNLAASDHCENVENLLRLACATAIEMILNEGARRSIQSICFFVSCALIAALLSLHTGALQCP